MRGVILYGPPAAGKDTVTRNLHELDSRFVLFPRLKAGSGRMEGYRITTDAEADSIVSSGAVIWENRRYGARYLIDRPYLLRQAQRAYPVLHLGQVPAVSAVVRAAPELGWVVVSLWCPRNIAASRIRARATGDGDARLQAWDETEALPQCDLFINTNEVTAGEAAKRIMQLVYGKGE